MKTIINDIGNDAIVDSTVSAIDDKAKEGDVCMHKLKPDHVTIFQDVYDEYGVVKTVRVKLSCSDIDKIKEHIDMLRRKEFETEKDLDGLPF